MKIIPENPHLQITHVICRYFTQVDSWLTTCKDLTKYCLHEILTLRAPEVLVPTPSTKGGWAVMDPPQYTKMANATNLKPSEVLGVSFKVSKNFK